MTNAQLLPAPKMPANDVPKTFSVELPNAPSIAGEGKPRVHYLHVERSYRIKQLGTTTVWDMFIKGKTASANDPFIGRRLIENGVAKHYVWETYNEAAVRIDNVASAMVHFGVKPQGTIGIFSKNSPEYLLTELAAYRQRVVNVPIYDTLVADKTVLKYMINLTELSLLFTTSATIETVLSIKDETPSLKAIITYDAVSDELKEAGLQAGITVLSFAEFESIGKQNPAQPDLPDPKDLAFICFTSGTTGMPKGVMLLHSMLTAAVERTDLSAEHGIDYAILSTDVHISYLPKAHVFEMALDIAFMGAGARIGFWQGDIRYLMDDIGELKPTCLASTPRVYNRIYDKVMGQVSKSSPIKRAIFNAAFTGKRIWLGQQVYKHKVWDAVIFKKIRQTLGGRIRLLFTGAAPITREVAEFLQIAFSVPLIEGYGQTESTASTSYTVAIDRESAGTIGVPVPGVQIKLVDVPDMGYLSTNFPPTGEICFKGPTAFPGYYKDPVKTAETIDADGWVHTGDIGKWDATGHLCLIDRKKNIFKLAQGEYISPEKVESVYSRHELVDGIFVHGESTESHLVAVVIVEKETLKEFLESKKFAAEGRAFEELVEDLEVRRVIKKELAAWARKETELKGFEIVKDVVLEHAQFADRGLLTPSFKLKRHEAKKFYQDRLNAMYAGTSSVNDQ
ncbi:hypothetical protein BC831DRAFT_448706 [Entophlyctis helioformis]|nr:hypothetical protein BC831DRAFT_448706 [Entophlyctis helioformis]